jgi:hypothetical protein
MASQPGASTDSAKVVQQSRCDCLLRSGVLHSGTPCMSCSASASLRVRLGIASGQVFGVQACPTRLFLSQSKGSLYAARSDAHGHAGTGVDGLARARLRARGQTHVGRAPGHLPVRTRP